MATSGLLAKVELVGHRARRLFAHIGKRQGCEMPQVEDDGTSLYAATLRPRHQGIALRYRVKHEPEAFPWIRGTLSR